MAITLRRKTVKGLRYITMHIGDAAKPEATFLVDAKDEGEHLEAKATLMKYFQDGNPIYLDHWFGVQMDDIINYKKILAFRC